MSKIALMNSAMIPQPGTFRAISMNAAAFAAAFQTLVAQGAAWESFIGYPQTAAFLSDLLGVEVPVSRAQTTLEPGDAMLVCKLKYRVADPATKGAEISEADFEFLAVNYE